MATRARGVVVGASSFVVVGPLDVDVLAFGAPGLLVEAAGPARSEDEQPAMAMIATNAQPVRRRSMLSLSHAAPPIERDNAE